MIIDTKNLPVVRKSLRVNVPQAHAFAVFTQQFGS
jgi:hypothetical protein